MPHYLKKTSFIAILFAYMLLPYHIVSASDLANNANIFLYPQPVPVSNLVFKSTSGQNVSLSDFRGKVVLLHFWSIQCPACKIEEPLLDSLKLKFGVSGLEILGVNLVDPPDSIARHAATQRPPFPVLFDGGNGFSLKMVNLGGRHTAFLVNPVQEAVLEIPGLPTTYIIDCRGSAVGFSVGAARWDNRAALGLIQNLIADRKSCLPNS